MPQQTGSRFTSVKRITNDMPPTAPQQTPNEHTLLLMFEKRRIAKLRELYHSKPARKKSDQPREDMLPTFSPRRQCPDHLARRMLSALNKRTRALDRLIETLLKDVAPPTPGAAPSWLLDPICTTPRSSSSAAVTPPPSPVSLLLPAKTSGQSREKEVAMSDDEIMSLWNCAEPSDNTVDFYGYEGTDT